MYYNKVNLLRLICFFEFPGSQLLNYLLYTLPKIILRKTASKNGCTFCLNKRLLCYIVVESFVTPCFFSKCQLGRPRFLLSIFNEVELTL